MSTREHILEQAFVLFASHGYDGVSLNQLLKAAGVAKGGFYHHFASKAEVFRVATETYVDAVLSDALAYLQSNRLDVRIALRFITVYCEALQDIRDGFSLDHFPGFYALIFSDGVHADDRHPRHTYTEWRREVLAELRAVLTRAAASGQVRPIRDPDFLAEHILHTLEGLVLEWSLGSAKDIMPLAMKEQQQLLELMDLHEHAPAASRSAPAGSKATVASTGRAVSGNQVSNPAVD